METAVKNSTPSGGPNEDVDALVCDWRRKRGAVTVPSGFADRVLAQCSRSGGLRPVIRPAHRHLLWLMGVAASLLFLLQSAALLAVLVEG